MSTKKFEQFVITAPPPTPNGDLHVGHLSGPYFGCDVLARYLRLRGHDVATALSVDLNQSYVVTTAERLRDDPMAMAKRSHREIGGTLAKADMAYDVLGIPDSGYVDYVTGWFRQMDATGLFVHRSRKMPFDVLRERFMFESYASGWCCNCLAATNGNICEACGHSNDPASLFGLHPTGGRLSDPVVAKTMNEYVFDIEPWREQLTDYFFKELPELRPSLRRLLVEMLDQRLPKFPITFPSNWGIPAPMANATGLVLNVWAEMLPGHYHWIEKALGRSLAAQGKTTHYYQFFGFDNSFFYAVAQVAMALAARSHGIPALLPNAFFTNEFLQLDNEKFSTSQGHLIWGRDLLEPSNVDAVRFYLAWINPEYSQANFTTADFQQITSNKLLGPLKVYEAQLSKCAGGQSHDSNAIAAEQLTKRFETAYAAERMSLRIVAQAVTNGLNLGVRLMQEGVSLATAQAFTRALAAGAAPLVPGVAARLWEVANAPGDPTWPVPINQEVKPPTVTVHPAARSGELGHTGAGDVR